MNNNISKYALSLRSDHRDCYDQYQMKIKDIGVDPFILKRADMEEIRPEIMPNISYADIYVYFVVKTSRYTHDQAKAYKSLEAYKFYESGYVRSQRVKVTSTKRLVIGQIHHSFRKDYASCWIWCNETGVILDAHCDCIAGLGERCSHVAALAFAIFDEQNMNELSVTDRACYWKMQSGNNLVMQGCDSIVFRRNQTSAEQQSYPVATVEQVKNLMTFVEESGSTGIFFKHKKHELGLDDDEDDGQENNSGQFLMLSKLNQEVYYGKTLLELDNMAKNIDLVFTADDADMVFRETIQQSKNTLWFEYRKGRITASNFHAACRTKITKPSISTIKKICYGSRFKSQATSYGCNHEQKALENYKTRNQMLHQNFIVTESGLVLNPEYPEFGATPDSLVNCSCHGEGCVEIKCPFCLGDQSVTIDEYRIKKKSIIFENNEYKMNKNHEYFYQVQLQLLLTGRMYCDFVIWWPEGLLIVRTYVDQEFIAEKVERARAFFILA